MKAKWLSRSVSCPGPCLILVFNQEECDLATKACGQPSVRYLSEHANATAHFMRDSKGVPVAIVAIGDVSGRSGVQIASLLVHEAVHVWQEHCSNIGEFRPGAEQEAYGVQCIAQELMEEYIRRTK